VLQKLNLNKLNRNPTKKHYSLFCMLILLEVYYSRKFISRVGREILCIFRILRNINIYLIL